MTEETVKVVLEVLIQKVGEEHRKDLMTIYHLGRAHQANDNLQRILDEEKIP